jgi:hypothetical protein
MDCRARSLTSLLCLLLVSIILVPGAAFAAEFAGTLETGIDRPGLDYKNVALDQASPAACAQQCADDSKCRAYTYVKPNVQGPKARCYLKSSAPGAITRDCCTSGVKKEGFVIVGEEPGSDRPGGNYKNFDLSGAQPALCRDQCAAEVQCKAYTYVKPGLQGPKARCWLKGSTPNRTANGCCTSGVKASAAILLTKEAGVDRTGGDYRNFDLTIADADLCRAACGTEQKCAAYTYVKPGVQGARARCWLKTTVAAAKNDDCCTSGTRDAGKPVNPPSPGKPLYLSFDESDRRPNAQTGLEFPADMPAVRFPAIEDCNATEQAAIRRAWIRAHYYTWRAHQVMQYLDRNDRNRKGMWSFGDNPGVANDAGNWRNYSPRAWFGPYDGDRFKLARDAIKKIWDERFRGDTIKRFKCRTNDSNKGAHPCFREIPATGNNPSANHIVLGTINLCNSWFSLGAWQQARNLVHETFHWLKIPNSPHWVSDLHLYCRNGCLQCKSEPIYGQDLVNLMARNSGCGNANHRRVVRANDAYAYFIATLGDFIRDKALTRFPAAGFDFD